MELYAAGFNAWNQLNFDSAAPSADLPLEPADITTFTRILSAQSIEGPASHLSCTLGHPGRFSVGDDKVDAKLRIPAKANGKVLVTGYPDTSAGQTPDELFHSVSTATSKTLDTRRRVPLSDLAVDESSRDAGSRAQACSTATVTQLVAYDTGFAALLDDASVWVSGDERFPNCLGGSLDSDEGPWRKVSWLNDLPTGPVVRIAAGGYTLAALTEGGDLYCWGGRPGQRPLFGEELSDVPVPINLGAVDADVRDVALGERHVLVLTTGGEVLVRGCNENGQLGQGRGGVDVWIDKWARVEGIPGRSGSEIVGVAAGPRTSFIIIQTKAGKT